MAAGRHAHKTPVVKAGMANSHARRGILDHELTARSGKLNGSSRVIITLKTGVALPPEIERLATVVHGRLGIINGHVVTVSNRVLQKIAAHPAVFQIDYDRPLVKQNFRTGITIGAPAVQRGYGLTGAGIGVAIIDSGIAAWHDDLTNRTATLYPYGNQRVAAFVDFVNGNNHPHDDDGHGTHVAGIIAGNGYDSNGQKAGVAPDATLVSLKVLDANGNGSISNIIAAFDWTVQHKDQFNIRVVNASVGALITESYTTDPLTVAAKRVVDAGIAVVVAAGNKGKNAAGQIQYGAITSPGNAPWVITVGASSTNGTPDRSDDTIASFSSRGPTYKDYAAKPDLVAPGVGTISLAAPGSTFYGTMPLVNGTVSTPYVPYLTLSGTSMAAPVVTGTIALMLQANPSLTPNMLKAILEYTAQPYAGYDRLTQGAGFLNTLGAVRFAQFYATAQPGDPIPLDSMWGKQLLWGNHLISGGMILPNANAFRVGTPWGVAKTDADENIVWGTSLDGDENIVWGTSFDGDENIVWGTDDGDENIVWGTDCGGADCDAVVWGSADTDDNIVWGTADGDENIVWGTSSDGDENIVWGTSFDGDENIVWGTADTDDNIVWGTDDSDENIVWGTMTNGVITWYGATGTVRPIDWNAIRGMSDAQVFKLFRLMTTNLPATSGGL
ncbi:MAG TPA: S8 family peptidase [Vicinamibacterales bacterium]|nr:S8 family peptidase [Vicinamibacterales bacterium]